MENNKRLDVVLSQYNELSNRLEEQYLEKRDEPEPNLVIRLEDLKTILIGTIACDNHSIASLVADGEKLTVRLEKL